MDTSRLDKGIWLLTLIRSCSAFARTYSVIFATIYSAMMPLPITSKRQSWTESERHEIQDYARPHPAEGWRAIKFWYEGQYSTKTSSQSQISKILHPKQPRGPSDASSIEPNYQEKLKSESKR